MNTPGLDSPEAGEAFYYAGSRIIERRIVEDTSGEDGGDGADGGGTGGGSWTGGGGSECTVKVRNGLWMSPSEKALCKAIGLDPDNPDHPSIADLLADNPKLEVQAAVGAQDPLVVQEYVHGLEYIDEHIAVYDYSGGTTTTSYVLQDANYNVVALVDAASGQPRYQFRYAPYGDFEAYEVVAADGTATGLDLTVYPPTTDDPDAATTPALYPFGFQGLWFDQVSHGYNNRAREYNLDLHRFLTQDPNGQALVLSSALMMNAATPMALAGFDPAAMYADGMNAFEFVGSNPVNWRDPSGLLLGLALSTDLRARNAGIVLTGAALATALILDLAPTGQWGVTGASGPGFDIFLRGVDLFMTGKVAEAAAYLTAIDVVFISTKQAKAVKTAKTIVKRINEHIDKLRSGDQGVFGNGPDHWMKEIRNWVEKHILSKAKYMGRRKRTEWEDYAIKLLKWIEDRVGPPPTAPG